MLASRTKQSPLNQMKAQAPLPYSFLWSISVVIATLGLARAIYAGDTALIRAVEQKFQRECIEIGVTDEDSILQYESYRTAFTADLHEDLSRVLLRKRDLGFSLEPQTSFILRNLEKRRHPARVRSTAELGADRNLARDPYFESDRVWEYLDQDGRPAQPTQHHEGIFNGKTYQLGGVAIEIRQDLLLNPEFHRKGLDFTLLARSLPEMDDRLDLQLLFLVADRWEAGAKWTGSRPDKSEPRWCWYSCGTAIVPAAATVARISARVSANTKGPALYLGAARLILNSDVVSFYESNGQERGKVAGQGQEATSSNNAETLSFQDNYLFCLHRQFPKPHDSLPMPGLAATRARLAGQFALDGCISGHVQAP